MSRHCALIAALLPLGAVLAGCGAGGSTTTAPAQTISYPAYHFSLYIPTGWVILPGGENDPTADAPFSLTIERANVSADATNSSFNLQITKLSAPGEQQFWTSLAHNPQYRPTTIGGHTAYKSMQVFYNTLPTLVPGQTSLPATTPVPGTPGTLVHTDYEVAAASFLYEIYTEAVAGDNADGDLAAMVQSFTITI